MTQKTFSKKAVIIGAGPAGLTAALELLRQTDIQPIVLEASDVIGGLSQTVNYKGNRIDIGPHRFFSKSDKVMQWWLDMMPLQKMKPGEQSVTYQNKTRKVNVSDEGPDPEKEDKVMLLVKRQTRIFYLRKFFSYPISLSKQTLSNLGIFRTLRIGVSFFKSILFPVKNEENLEQFFINRFGEELYLTFFKSYTEKVWGVPCNEITADWGAQRIKGLSISSTIMHFLKQVSPFKKQNLSQKNTETSLIEQFIYPKLGAGQMWEETAAKVKELGGEVLTGWKADKITVKDKNISAVEAVNKNGDRKTFEGDFFFSTMPMKELVQALDTNIPAEIREISEGLLYRDFIEVCLLLDKLKIKDHTGARQTASGGAANLMGDNWIYLQDPDIRAGRLQICNNMSPYLLADPTNVWLGVEYFCYETDDIWKQTEPQLIELATTELERIGMIDRKDLLDATVIKMKKAYPAYFGTYNRFEELREYMDNFGNLFLIGRNGMHKYNNQDHSILTAMVAVENIKNGNYKDKSEIWAVNTEQEYIEEKK